MNVKNRVKDMAGSFSLLMTLSLAQIKQRYRRPYMGMLWMLIRPLCMAIMLKLVFSVIMRIEIHEYPFFLYLITAIFSWEFSNAAIVNGTTCFLDSRILVRETRVPRIYIPVSVVIAGLLNHLPGLAVVGAIVGVSYGLPLTIVALPLVLAVHAVFLVTLVLITSVAQVMFRDVRHIVDVGILMFFYATPIFYPLSMVSDCFYPLEFNLYMLNPFVSIMCWYRVCFLPGYLATLPVSLGLLQLAVIPLLEIAVLVGVSRRYFSRREHAITDRISA